MAHSGFSYGRVGGEFAHLTRVVNALYEWKTHGVISTMDPEVGMVPLTILAVTPPEECSIPSHTLDLCVCVCVCVCVYVGSDP